MSDTIKDVHSALALAELRTPEPLICNWREWLSSEGWEAIRERYNRDASSYPVAYTTLKGALYLVFGAIEPQAFDSHAVPSDQCYDADAENHCNGSCA